jgi:dolichol-phosphate mannosyltransferase
MGSATTSAGAELAIIVPTFCEKGNLLAVVDRIRQSLGDVRWEVVFVDDNSPDGTADLARALACQDSSVRCVQRIGRRGLSTAVIEGILATSAPYIAVMDADSQHDEQLLYQMLQVLRSGEHDIVVGSRYAPGGTVGDWDHSRSRLSRVATRLSRTVLRADLADPMSGFFAMRREMFMRAAPKLSGIGFKILLDIFTSSPVTPRFLELPYRFGTRRVGESKLDNQAAWDYFMLLLDKLVGRFVPIRFVAFGIVGGLGLIVHLLVMATMIESLELPFVTSQTAATLVAMTFNYAVNNEVTYRDMRLRGLAWFRGWLTFTIACSVGALANVGIAAYLFELKHVWPVAAIAGVLVGAVWNYAVTMIYTWRRNDAPR